MELVDQSIEVWGECPSDLFEAKRWIERAGRTCYNSSMSEPPNPDAYIDKLMSFDPPHSSVLEHSNWVFKPSSNPKDEVWANIHLATSRWIHPNWWRNYFGNIRAFCEAVNLSVDNTFAKLHNRHFQIVPVEDHVYNERRVTVTLVTDRNVLAELTRHRNDVAFSVRSQRYVDESKDMQFIKPSWWDEADFIQQETFLLSCEQAELNYKTLRKSFAPQHARVALNGQCRTVIVMTAYLPQWDWIFKLRRAPGAYPQMRELMDMVYSQFEERGYVENH